MRVLIALLLLSSVAHADPEPLTLVERKAIEAIQREFNDAIAEIGRNHKFQDGDTVDLKTMTVVRAPSPPKAPPKK